MAKKKDKAVETAANKQLEQRLAAIREFNMNNMGQAWIDPERVPTDEEKAQAKKDFEDRVNALKNKHDYLIADSANALRVAKFIKNFVENGFWTQRYFVGVINFTELITKFIDDCEKEPRDLVMEYGPLQFCMLMFENYAGFGLESAKKMAEMWDEYVPIYDTLRDHVTFYENEAKQCEKLKQRWAMFEQGYYLVLLDEEDNHKYGEEDNTDKVEQMVENTADTEQTAE